MTSHSERIYDDQIETDVSACEWGFGPKYTPSRTEALKQQYCSNERENQSQVQ